MSEQVAVTEGVLEIEADEDGPGGRMPFGVSTVHWIDETGGAVFETKVFFWLGEAEERYTRRYQTRGEALAGHAEVVEEVQAP